MVKVLCRPRYIPSAHGLFDRRHLGGSLIVARVCLVDIAPDPRRGRAPVSRRIGKSGRLGVVAWGWDEQKGGRPGSLGKVNPAICFNVRRRCRWTDAALANANASASACLTNVAPTESCGRAVEDCLHNALAPHDILPPKCLHVQSAGPLSLPSSPVKQRDRIKILHRNLKSPEEPPDTGFA